VSGLNAAVLVLTLAVPRAAMAQTSPPPDRGRELRYDLVTDLAVTGGAGITWLTLELLTPSLVEECRWCDRNDDGSDALNGFDRELRQGLRWNNTESADTWSTVFSFVLAPLLGFAAAAVVTHHDERLHELPPAILIVAESALIAMSLNQIVKIVAARERPNAHARSPEERTARRQSTDNLSFFSGHTNLAFALAISAGTIASMRGYRLSPLMWATGLTCASVGGYLRIAADRHYASDVLMGAAFGAAVGFVVPYVFHRPTTSSWRLTAAPTKSGASMLLSARF
jgi:membrane-associated phospholipid phosphatase